MSRARLEDRRPAVTRRVMHVLGDGKEQGVLVTVGYDRETLTVREVFCADFKTGSDISALIVDACIVTSLLMQHGLTVEEIERRLADRRDGVMVSLIGTLVRAAAETQRELRP